MGWAGSARGSPAGSLPQGHSVLPPLRVLCPAPAAGTAAPGWHIRREDRKMEGKRGAEGMESKPEEGVWLEREQHEGYRASVSGELHTGQAEATSGRTGVQAPSPHPLQCCRLKKCLMGYTMAAYEMFLEVWGHRGSDNHGPSAPLAVLSRAASPLQGPSPTAPHGTPRPTGRG